MASLGECSQCERSRRASLLQERKQRLRNKWAARKPALPPKLTSQSLAHGHEAANAGPVALNVHDESMEMDGSDITSLDAY